MVVKALEAAAAFALRAWRSCWAALALGALAAGAALYGVGVAWAAAIALGLIARGGLWRLALAHGRPGLGGLQGGMVELRLLSTALLASVFLATLALLLITALLCLTFALATTGPGFDVSRPESWAGAIPPAGRVVLTAAIAACGLGLIFAAARISLAEPAGVARSRVQLLAAWPLTRGRALPIIVGNLILAVPPLAAVALYWTQLRAVAPACLAVIGVGLWLPLQVGLMTYLFQGSPGPER